MQQQSCKKTKRGLKACTGFLLAVALCLQMTVGGFLGLGSVTAFASDGPDTANTRQVSVAGVTLYINEDTGDLSGITFSSNGNLSGQSTLDFDAAYVDFGYDGGDGAWESWGGYMRNTLFYQNLDNLYTYELPYNINYNTQSQYPRLTPDAVSIEETGTGAKVTYTMPAYDKAQVMLQVQTVYTVNAMGYVTMDSTLTNTHTSPVIINGAATVVSGLDLGTDALFEMPGNIPAEVYSVVGLPAGQSVVGEYSSPLIHFFDDGADINLIFANEHEKWAPSVTKALNGKVDVINLSCTIDTLQAGETLYLGRQFFQLADGNKAYSAAQNLYSDNGWKAPTDGVKGSPVYSGHPAGVSDNNFADAEGTLQAYESKLADIKALGFDSLWLLPVFEHPDSGGSVYLPYNMEYIDSRYSEAVENAGNVSLEEARALAYAEMEAFGAAAVDEGLNFMIDYVPHGPYKYGKDEVISEDNVYDNPWFTEDPSRWEWATQDRWYYDTDYDHYRVEWNAYAFDFANQDYLDYMYDLVKQQSEDFSMAGTRIDAVMGSLPNWTPYVDENGNRNRTSQTGLYGGARMTEAMRNAILDAGHTPLVLPENNNPTPYFAEYTDLFYDMPFHRVTLDSRKAGQSELEFAATVAHWLKTESASSTEGMQFGRFLENHDTVAPWYPNYDGKRAVEVYGLEKARALWVLLSTIDGAPIIYQNDENGNETFFANLLAMRKTQFGQDNGMAIEYYNDATSGIIAYRRYSGSNQKLVLVNLLPEAQTRDFSNIDVGGVKFSTASPDVVYGSATISGDAITLPAYGYAVINLTGGESFNSPNTAPQFLVKNIAEDLAELDAKYREQADNYVSFSIDLPAFEPAGLEDEQTVFDPVEDYSAETPAGPIWKYMYYNAKTGEVEYCETPEGNADGVWRAYKTGDGEWDFEWAGAGRSNSYYPDYHYFELDTNTGAEVYGLLVFVAPADGTYLMPAFDVIDVGEGKTSILVLLKNGAHQDKTPMMYPDTGKTRMPAQVFDLNAGDTLTFYMARMDGAYSYAELDRMRIVLVEEEDGPLDNSALLAQIHEAELALLLGGYTAESSAALQQAIEAANAVAGNDKASAEDIAGAVTALQEAIAALSADKQALEDLLAQAKGIAPDGYTAESYDALQQAIANAENVAGDTAATVGGVAAEITALQAAVDGLYPEAVDDNALQALLDKARGYTASGFTYSSYEALLEAIANAETAAPEDLLETYQALHNAIRGLSRVDKAALESAIAYAQNIDAGLYTTESHAALVERLAAAQGVVDDPDADQAAVNGALEALREAVNALEKKAAGPNKIDLLRQIGIAKAYLVVADKYTEESVAQLKAALKAAQEVAEDEAATQEAVQEATAALVKAMESLEEIDTGRPDPEPGPEPEPGPDPSPNPGPGPNPNPNPNPNPGPGTGTGTPGGGNGGDDGSTGKQKLYKVLEGAKQTYKGSGNLVFRSEGEFGKFQKVFVNGYELTLNVDYMVEEGSTIVTLLEGYLKSLAGGTHTLQVQFEDGITIVTFTVEGPSGSGGSSATGTGSGNSAIAETGDTTSTIPFVVLAALAVVVLAVALVIKRRRSMR